MRFASQNQTLYGQIFAVGYSLLKTVHFLCITVSAGRCPSDKRPESPMTASEKALTGFLSAFLLWRAAQASSDVNEKSSSRILL